MAGGKTKEHWNYWNYYYDYDYGIMIIGNYQDYDYWDYDYDYWELLELLDYYYIWYNNQWNNYWDTLMV